MSSEGSAGALTEPTKVLYVNNLNDKLHIENVLKRQLYRLFSQYGKVEEVIAFKGLKGRGQAWVVYQEVNAAAAALRAKQGFNFYEKPLKIAFAKINPSKTMTIKAKVDAGKVAAAASKKRKSAEVETDEKSSSSQILKKASA